MRTSVCERECVRVEKRECESVNLLEPRVLRPHPRVRVSVRVRVRERVRVCERMRVCERDRV